jgi:hypothetical protein
MAKLTTAARTALPDSAFLGPNRSYPAEDANHARSALSMAAAYAPPSVAATVKAGVHQKFPSIGYVPGQGHTTTVPKTGL